TRRICSGSWPNDAFPDYPVRWAAHLVTRSAEQPRDRFPAGHGLRDLARQTGDEADLAHVEQRVQDRRQQVRDADRLAVRLAAVAAGAADHLAHAQPATGQQQRGEVAPVVAAAVAVDPRRAAHLAA